MDTTIALLVAVPVVQIRQARVVKHRKGPADLDGLVGEVFVLVTRPVDITG